MNTFSDDSGAPYADVFSVIGDPVKRQILHLINGQELTVTQLVNSLGLSQPTISKHLRKLREAGLVDVRVDGQRRWYLLRDAKMQPLKNWIDQFPRG